jgi:hypothetical protein
VLGSLSAQQFTDVKATAFPSQTPSASLGNPIWGDIDGDGDLNLIVPTASTAPAIYLNDNDGADPFTVDTTSGIGPQPNSSDGWKGFALGDYDEDGDLDLFIAADEGRRSGESLSSNIFFINNGSGTFSHSTDTALLDPMAHGKSGFWVDYNNNGHLKLFVKNYGTANLLYKLRTSGDFVSISGADGLDIATSFGPNDNYHGNNCAFQDYDNDGDMDVVFSHDRTQLWRNDAPGGYTIMADTLVTPTSEKGKGVAWGTTTTMAIPIFS